MSLLPEASDAAIVRALTQAIAADRWAVPHTDPPQRDEVVAALERLRTMLFPRLSPSQPRTPIELEAFVHRQLTDFRPRLYRQVVAAYASAGSANDRAASAARATEAVDRFLLQIGHIRETLAVDAQAAFDGDPAARSVDEVVLCYPGFHALLIHRVAHALHVLGVPLVPRMMAEWAHATTGIDIHPGATIGRGCFIDHGTGVVVGETVSIGEFCKLYQGVTLGARSFERDESGKLRKGYKRHPTLEDHVTVYAGATILGGDTVIGRGSTIGGNVWLTRSVPPGTTVVLDTPSLRFFNLGDRQSP